MDPAISLADVSKRYKLYRRRSARLLDFLGIMPGHVEKQYDEFWALRDVSLEIERGATVGVIGRNGAGKSTLLKLLAGTTAPTQGAIRCQGRVSALLELGTGFHPDLTGHENIYAGGLYLGLDRRATDRLYEQIVAFADLGEFLHQPVRTYSSGMYLRLGFAVATCLPADIQVIDEVLGVGDLNFFGKCLKRFRQLQAQGRTTVLVSHDHATVLRLCSRCIWIDQGRIVADGTPLEVIAAYNDFCYRERDRQTEVAGCFSGAEPTRTLRINGAVCVEGVEFLQSEGQPTRTFSTGEPLVLRIVYRSRVTLRRPVVAVTIYRADGVLVCNAISSTDNADLEILEGEGAIELVFDPLMLGPGDYTAAVGIYPSLNLADPVTMQHAVLWYRNDSFSVRKPIGVAVDLGVFRHPANWRQASGQPASLREDT